MSIHYSYSRLTKADVKIELFSSFHHLGDFFSYVVTQIIHCGDKHERSEKSFSTICKAEGFHMESVLQLAYTDGYTLEMTTCK